MTAEGNKLTGRWEAIANGDGYVLKDKNVRLSYDLDLEVKDGIVTGTYKGFYDRRAVKSGEITAGVWRND